MRVALNERAILALANAPVAVQRAFIKQMNLLSRNLLRPSLHAKKYNVPGQRWQARVNDDWRFYFLIDRDTYRIDDIIPHPK